MDFDSETLLNGAAAAVTTIAVIIFIIDRGFPYSPVTKTMLVVAFLAGVFAVSQATDDDQLTLLGYGVVVVSTVALLIDLSNKFDLGTTGQVLLLLGLAVALFGLRMQLDDRSRFTSGARAKQAFAALAAVAVVVLTIDVVSGGLAYELQTQQQVEISGGENPEVGGTIGEVVVTNNGPFPQQIDMPRYSVCAAGNWSEYQFQESDGETRPVNAHLRVDRDYGDHVFGFAQKRYDAVVRLHAQNASGEQFRVEQTEACPDEETGEPYLAVYERDDRPPYGYAV